MKKGLQTLLQRLKSRGWKVHKRITTGLILRKGKKELFYEYISKKVVHEYTIKH